MPVVTPAELWQTRPGATASQSSGRPRIAWAGPFVLAMTHEETVTFHAREISSYRQLPQILYHFQTKVRDEPRPRAGLIRVREFVMKDSYSFDRDEEGLERSFRAARARLPPHLRALRARVLRRRGGVGDDGRQRVRRLPGAVGVGREHARHLRERRLRRRPRGRARHSAPARVPGAARRARRGRDAGRDDHRRRLRSSSGSTRPRRRRRCRS